MKSGYFGKQDDSFTVNGPDLPRPFDTMLFNEVCYANIHHTGIGTFDYQYPGEEGIRLLSGVGRTCDEDVFGKEHLYSRLIYVRDNQTGHFWTVNWEPVCRWPQKFTCTHGIASTEIVNVTEDVEVRWTLTVPPGRDPVELWSLTAADVTGRPRDLTLFVYFQVQFHYKWGFDSYGDRIYRTTRYDRENNLFLAEKHPYVRPHNHLTAFFTGSRPVDGYDGSRRRFMGEYGTAAAPRCVVGGRCTDSDGSDEDTVCALQWRLPLSGRPETLYVMFGAADGEEGAAALRDTYLPRVPYWLTAAEENRRRELDRCRVDTGEPQLNRLLNTWTKLGCLFGAHWCRWGYNGYRDIAQHAMGVVNIEPLRTKAILEEAFSYQYSTGMAVRGWNPVDDRPYSDSALWSVYTLCAYIKETDDRAFLSRQVAYLDGGQATVLQHASAALDFLENNRGSHGLLLIKFGDWNDSLTGAGKEGRGESLWLSMAYVYALREAESLCRYIGKNDLASEMLRRSTAMKKALETHGFEEDRYIRCYTDDGEKIGSKHNTYGRLFLESQSFAFMIGLGDARRRQTVLDTLDREAATPLGYRLLTPSYREFDHRVGRLSAMEPGIAENGTVYTHPNMWMVLGLLRCRMPDRAWALFQKVAPGFVNEDNRSLKEQNLPYQFANGYFGPDHKNSPYQMEYSWVTGSLAWVRPAMEEWMLGVRADWGGLRIDPCLPAHFGGYTVTREYQGSRYCIGVTPVDTGETAIAVDGVPLEGTLLPVFRDGREHRVEVLWRERPADT